LTSGVVIKSERELDAMREAGRVNALALGAAAAIVRPGITTSEIDSIKASINCILRENQAALYSETGLAAELYGSCLTG